MNNKSKILMAIMGLALISAPSIANDVTVHETAYKGNLGNNPIFLKITRANYKDGSKIFAGQYFYSNYRLPIELISNGSNGLSFHETFKNCYYDPSDTTQSCKITGTFELRPEGDGLVGVWKNQDKSKSFPVKLSQIYDNKSVKTNDYFDNPYWINQFGAGIKIGNEKISGKTAYAIGTDTQSKINYPILTRHPNKIVLNKVSRLMRNNLMQMISWGYECKAMNENEGFGYGTYGSWNEYQTKVKIINDRFLVTEEGGSTYCGGAHPNNSFSHETYDLVRGEMFNFDHYFIFQRKAANGSVESTKEFERFLTRLTPKSKYAIAGGGNEIINECFTEDFTYPYSYSLGNKGVIFSLEDLPHVIGACMGDYYEVPYKDLKQFMTPAGLKFFAPELR